MDSNKGTPSRIFALSPIEAKEEIDEKLERSFAYLQSLINGVSEKEAHDALNAAVCKGPQVHDDISSGFLYGILADGTNAARYYRDVTFTVRDGLQHLISTLSVLILEKYTKLLDTSRSQLIWLMKELIKNSVPGVDNLCQSLLRQIAGGDVSPKNIWLAEAMLDIFLENRPVATRLHKKSEKQAQAEEESSLSISARGEDKREADSADRRKKCL